MCVCVCGCLWLRDNKFGIGLYILNFNLIFCLDGANHQVKMSKNKNSSSSVHFFFPLGLHYDIINLNCNLDIDFFCHLVNNLNIN